MSTEVQLAYDGEALRQHAMDVDELAPALQSVSDLCKHTNLLVNGNRASLRVLVQSDFQHQGFLISFQVLLDAWKQVQGVISTENIKTAKEQLEWLGLLGMPAGLGVFPYLKRKRGRRVTSVSRPDRAGLVTVQLEGQGGPIAIDQNVYNLSRDPTILKSVRGVLRPLQVPGVDRLEIREQGKVLETIDRDEAHDIIESEDPGPDLDLSDHPTIVDATLAIYSPVFDPKAATWRFLYGDRVIRARVAGSGMAEDILTRGSVKIGDAYAAKLEITPYITQDGRVRHSYRVISVQQFLPASTQGDLFLRRYREEE